MAERGGQPGNQNAVKNRPWHQAIQRALRKRSRSDQLEALDEIAEAFLDSVKAGDIQAFKELGDRLDGKPAQSVEITADVTNRASQLSDDTLAEIANAGNRNQT